MYESKNIYIKDLNGDVLLESNDTNYKELVQKAVRRKVSLENANLSNLELSNIDFGTTILKGVSFKNSIMNNCRFYDSSIVNCNFTNVNLSGSIFDKVLIENMTLRGLDLTCVEIRCSTLKNIKFYDTILSHMKLQDNTYIDMHINIFQLKKCE